MDFLNIKQIKEMSISDAARYCDALREHLVDTVTRSGGHLASNLGVAEISMACVRVFDIPKDKIIYDVGHQSYIHKLLTGRKLDYTNLRAFNGYSGFTKREESVYDPFGAGHSSTALSAAVGFAKAARVKGEDSTAVAIIGDGAFCTGMTFEALNNIDPEDRIIIILNDNEMSISKNVGAMSEYFLKIRSTKKYLRLKSRTKKAFLKIPIIGNTLSRFAGAVKDFVKHFVIKNTFFEELGIDYLGPADGNDLETVERLLRDAKDLNGPILVHLCTTKGKGFAEAEKDPDRFHAVSPASSSAANVTTFSDTFGEYLITEAEADSNAVAVTAAMCDGTGLNGFSDKFADRFYDVGICEEHAVTFCGAMSAAGLKPYFAVYSTFFQRSYDQLLHDVSLQNLKITLALDRAGFSSHDGPTHHGVFDVSLLLSVPNMTVFSPATFDEMRYSFDVAKHLPFSVAVRYPKGGESVNVAKAFNVIGDYCFDEKKKAQILFVTYGKISEEVLIAKKYLETVGITSCVLKFLKIYPVDFLSVSNVIKDISPSYICVAEEGIKNSGFGEYFISNLDNRTAVTDIIAIDGAFVPHGTLRELYDYSGLSAEKIVKKVLLWMKKN